MKILMNTCLCFVLAAHGQVRIKSLYESFLKYFIQMCLVVDEQNETVRMTSTTKIQANYDCQIVKLVATIRRHFKQDDQQCSGPYYFATGQVLGAPYHPQTQDKIERWHQTFKNRILVKKDFLPGDLERQIKCFVELYNHKRFHESPNNVTPADVNFSRVQSIYMTMDI